MNAIYDAYTDFCIFHERRPCEPKSDFCGECIEDGSAEDQFGRCYQCRDFHDHEDCIGVPCQCPCPPPDELKRKAEREQILSKLTPHERQVLGI